MENSRWHDLREISLPTESQMEAFGWNCSQGNKPRANNQGDEAHNAEITEGDPLPEYSQLTALVDKMVQEREAPLDQEAAAVGMDCASAEADGLGYVVTKEQQGPNRDNLIEDVLGVPNDLQEYSEPKTRRTYYASWR